MKKQSTRTGFVMVLCTILVAGILGLLLHFARRIERIEAGRHRSVLAAQPVGESMDNLASSAIPEVVVGTPEFYGEPVRERYRYRNDYEERANQTKLTLYLVDNETGKEVRLGNDSSWATLGTLDEEYFLWFFGAELHAYELATGMDTTLATLGGRLSFPQRSGKWVAFGEYKGDGSKVATLFAGNIQTHEVITLTKTLWAPNAMVNGYFGIGAALAAWYDPPDGIIIYDLQQHRELMRITNLFSAFHESPGEIYGVSAGETVVTWNQGYGYDLVTRSYFPMGRTTPLDGDEPYVTMSRIHEADRVLSWSFTYEDGTTRHVRAPLLDATPSTAPCVDGQNLVQNGDLESTTDHALWQQSGSTTNLLVNDPPPGLANGGQWAIRLGRFNNAQQAIQQTVAIPSGVKGLTLTFAVRVHSWDLWGGDRLQLDLVDPRSGQSLLATPVQWTNTQLASGDWIPLQVAIENWPGIDTPVTLVFRTQTDWAFPTDFTIDQVKLLTHCLSE